MKNELEYNLADSMFQKIRRCFEVGVCAALLLSMFSVMVDQIELADFLLRIVAVSVAMVCTPLLLILTVVKRLNK